MAYSFSLAFLTVHDVAPDEAVKIAAQCGYSHVGFRMLPTANEGPFPIMEDDKLLRETQAVLKDTGVQLADIEIIRIGEAFDVEQTRAFLARGQALGAQNVLVAGDDPEESRLTENYAAFCDAAAEFGLTADLEFMPWTQVPDLDSAHRIVQAVQRPNSGVLVDALHYHRAGVTADQVAKVDPKLLHYVQFCDAAQGFDPSTEGLIRIARGERQYPGEGEIDLVSLLKVLSEDMVLSIEVPNLELAKTLTPLQRAQRAMDGMKKVIAAAS